MRLQRSKRRKGRGCEPLTKHKKSLSSTSSIVHPRSSTIATPENQMTPVGERTRMMFSGTSLIKISAHRFRLVNSKVGAEEDVEFTGAFEVEVEEELLALGLLAELALALTLVLGGTGVDAWPELGEDSADSGGWSGRELLCLSFDCNCN